MTTPRIITIGVGSSTESRIGFSGCLQKPRLGPTITPGYIQRAYSLFFEHELGKMFSKLFPPKFSI